MTGSRGPLSSPNGPNRRSSKGVQLPAEGYKGSIPDWPLLEATQVELHRWETMWRKVQAAQWARMDIAEVVAKYVRVSLIVEEEMRNNVATAQTLNSLMAMEKELGLTPAALKRLEWEIVADEVAEKRDTSANTRRIRAVDSDAVAGA